MINCKKCGTQLPDDARFCAKCGSPINSSSNSSSSSSSSSNSSGTCFVATAAFGTPWAEEINVLRKWRDGKLKFTIPGRLFIKSYYHVGPSIAKLVRGNKVLMTISRWIIRNIIKLVKE